ncbi:volume-regulated anion channel subunit LRRC8A-like isoform X1 [Montipora capricornis]|uniref:volume-regulated anion channel subunit LRRC8A-like isoform X1 n=1 Tax=Montipora capricornis TaxID=246305 RepID=UPI0035F13558
MDSKLPSPGTTELLSTWWDVIDHYLLAVMLAVSVASFGLQTTKDNLICIPAVKCSAVAENSSAFGNSNGSSDVLNVCKKLSLPNTSIVLTTMSDRRQYDYVDNECYSKMHWFTKFYSLIFLAETVILLAISNFWQKFPNTRCALAHCEHLLSEFNQGQLESSSSVTNRDLKLKGPFELSSNVLNRGHGNEEELRLKGQFELTSPNYDPRANLLDRLKIFENRYSKEISCKDRSSVTIHYRVRGALGSGITAIFLICNIWFYTRSTSWTSCSLDGVTVVGEHSDFQCSRSNGGFLVIVTVLFLFSLVCACFLFAGLSSGRFSEL